jgi:hypothetical protein
MSVKPTDKELLDEITRRLNDSVSRNLELTGLLREAQDVIYWMMRPPKVEWPDGLGKRADAINTKLVEAIDGVS